jgi:muconate cycloisomerase
MDGKSVGWGECLRGGTLKILYREFQVHKRVALAISRGVQSGSSNWEILVESDGVVGIGEAAEFSIPGSVQSSEYLGSELVRAAGVLSGYSVWDRELIGERMVQEGIASSVRSGIDMALWDWVGKVGGIPTWRMLGLSSRSRVPTSVTIGIQSAESAKGRWMQWMELGTLRAVKVKMGSSGGIEADQAMYRGLEEVLPEGIHRSVDANGGWSVEEAIAMSYWLGERGVDHIEQPTHPDDIEGLRAVHRGAGIPIMADESCRTSEDIPRLSECCSGINIKVLKCGGMSEALRMVHTARSHGLRVMLGCYSQTVLGNTAANQLGALVDYIDLDSHLNLRDDPYRGCHLEDGFLVNNHLPGLGVTHA